MLTMPCNGYALKEGGRTCRTYLFWHVKWAPWSLALVWNLTLPTNNGIEYALPFQKEGKSTWWVNTGPKHRKLRGANFKFCIFISDIKTFFISPTLFSFFDYSILLSLELALHLFISFPLEVFRDISNILDFIINLGFTYQPLQVSMLGYPLHIPFFFPHWLSLSLAGFSRNPVLYLWL